MKKKSKNSVSILYECICVCDCTILTTQKRLTIVYTHNIWYTNNTENNLDCAQVRARKRFLYGQQNIYLADK